MSRRLFCCSGAFASARDRVAAPDVPLPAVAETRPPRPAVARCLGARPRRRRGAYAAAAAPHLLKIPQATIDEERAIFEAKLQKLADEANRKLELRTRELERTKDLRREECDAAEKKERDEEGAASSATLAKHRDNPRLY